MASSHDHFLAKLLARRVLEGGEDAVPQLREALQRLLHKRSRAEQRRFLRLFHKIVQREVHRDTLTIESPAGVETPVRDGLVERFQTSHPRRLQVSERQCPELIGGLRIRLGDTVYDASVSAKLERLARNIH